LFRATCGQTTKAPYQLCQVRTCKTLYYFMTQFPADRALKSNLSHCAQLSNAGLDLPTVVSLETSHASIAYRKQLHPQRTVGTIGSVWQESTPSKETAGPAQTNTQSTKNYQEGYPLDSNQLTTCEGRLTKTWRFDSPWWCVAESRTE